MSRPTLQLVKTSEQTPAETPSFNRRRFERFTLPAGYTAITVQRTHQESVSLLTGHAYDISESGVRFELDEPLMPGEQVAASVTLPCENVDVHITGKVVWLNDAIDDPGPRRMAIDFCEFASASDHNRLVNYLSRGRLARAA